MTRPGGNSASAADTRLAASLTGAVDLSGVRNRVEAQKEAEKRRTGPVGAAPGGGARTSVDVDESTFEEEVLNRSMQVPVVLELISSRAPTEMTATLSALADSSGGTWVHARADVDTSPGIAQALQAQAVPHVSAIAAGRPLAQFEETQPEETLRQWIAAVLQATEGKLSGPAPAEDYEAVAGEAEDPERDAAEAALADGDLALAEERFVALAESRKGDHTLLEALRFVQASLRLESDDYGDGVVPTALRSADRALLTGEAATAFDILVSAIRVSAGDDKKALRERLLELFDARPVDDPEVLTGRRNLASALY